MIPGIYATLSFFNRIFVNIYNINDIKSIIINRNIIHVSLKPIFFKLATAKSEIFSKHNGYDFISEPFALN